MNLHTHDSRPLHLDAGLLALRLMLATVYVFHGAQKVFGAFGGHGIDGFAGFLGTLGVPLPYFSAWAAALSELLGGIALATGFLFRPLLVPLTFTMLVASFSAHGGAFSAQAGGMEYPLTLAVASASLLLTGAGRYRIGGGEEAEVGEAGAAPSLARVA